MRVLYLDCPSGISGDMFIGALLDAGLNLSFLQQALSKLGLDGYKICKKIVVRHSIRGTKFDVLIDKRKNGRSLKEILSIIAKSKLDSEVKELSKKIFLNIANAESKIHNCDIDKVHFHEIGDLDSIIDIVGAAIAVKKLAIDKVYGSPLNLGKTAPATLSLLQGYKINFSPIPYELVTPTGAAIFRTLVEKVEPPPMDIASIGYGAGDNEIDETPNFLRVIIGDATESLVDKDVDKIIIIEANIDDTRPIMYDYIMQRLLDAGALDVFITPVYTKKTRVAILLTVLTKNSRFNEIVNIIFEETTTIGLRYYEANRFLLKRKIKRMKTKHGMINFKVSKINKDKLRISPEYEDCKRLARKRGVPLQKLYNDVLKGHK